MNSNDQYIGNVQDIQAELMEKVKQSQKEISPRSNDETPKFNSDNGLYNSSRNNENFHESSKSIYHDARNKSYNQGSIGNNSNDNKNNNSNSDQITNSNYIRGETILSPPNISSFQYRYDDNSTLSPSQTILGNKFLQGARSTNNTPKPVPQTSLGSSIDETVFQRLSLSNKNNESDIISATVDINKTEKFENRKRDEPISSSTYLLKLSQRASNRQ